MKRYLVTETSFIANTLLAPGSIVTEADLNGAGPGSALTEIDKNGKPLDKDYDGVVAGPVEIAPVAPHAPNPTVAQGIPSHAPGDANPLVTPAEGVESNADAEARAKQKK